MNPETDDALWQRISTALFGVRRATDERIFTAAVMTEIRRLQPADSSWKVFARWALPALALSMGGFTLAAWYSLEPTHVSAETILQAEASLYDDSILDTAVNI